MSREEKKAVWIDKSLHHHLKEEALKNKITLQELIESKLHEN